MGLDALLKGIRRGGSGSGDERAVNLNEYDEVLVAHGFPRYTEMSRRGRGYTCITETLFDPVAAVPTTVAELELYNNSSAANPLVMIVVDLFASQVLSTAATQTYSIWAMVSTQKAVPSLAALELYSLSGKPAII